jgi:6-phosphogluconolactonase (cycloisomerase 2 family)
LLKSAIPAKNSLSPLLEKKSRFLGQTSYSRRSITPAALKFCAQGLEMKSARSRSFLSNFFLFASSILSVLSIGCGQMTMSSTSSTGPTPTPTPAISNPNNFTYVTVQSTFSVEGFRIDSTGAVVPITGSPFAVPDTPLGLARTQQFLFVSSINFNVPTSPDRELIMTYRIDSDTGALTQVATHPAVNPSALTVDPTGRLLYATVRDGVSVFSIGATGQLSEVPGSFGDLSANLGQIVLHPSDRLFYAGGFPASGHSPSQGTMVANVDPTTGAVLRGQFLVLAARSVAITTDGKFLLATTIAGAANAVCTYAIDPVNGYPGGSFSTLVPQSTSCAGTGVDGLEVVVTPSGSFAMVTNPGSNSVSVFRMSSGLLTEVPGSPFSAGSVPEHIAISRDGRFVFVGNSNSDDVTVYQLDNATGKLAPVPGSPFKLSGFLGLVIS